MTRDLQEECLSMPFVLVFTKLGSKMPALKLYRLTGPGFSTLYLTQETHFLPCHNDPAIGLGVRRHNNFFNPRGCNRLCNVGKYNAAL